MNPNQIVNGIVRKLWHWLQNTSAIERTLFLILIYVVVGVALEQLAYWFRSSENVKPWNPAAGWNVVFLLGFGLRYGLAIPLVSIIEGVFLGSQETIIGGVINGANVAFFATTGSALMLYKLDLDPRLSRLQDVIRFSVIAGLFSLMYAVVDMSTLLALDKVEPNQLFTKTMHDWAGEATGIAMLAPPLLILLRKFPWSEKRLDIQGSAPEFNFSLPKFEDIRDWLMLLGVTILFTWAAYGGVKSPGLDYTYFTFIPLTWISAWKGFEAATVIIFAINVLAVALVGKQVTGGTSLALQFGLMTVTFIGLVLSAVVSSQKEENIKCQSLEKQLRYDATHDSLTGLYNRAWFLERLEQAESKVQENKNQTFALLFLDLDRFKVVNDSLGHLVGDRLLVEIAQKLPEYLPESTPVARLGGDEFIIILEDLVNISQASQIAETICQHLGQTYRVDGYEVFTTVSIGIALSTSDGKDTNLLRNADIALYEAKTRGKSQYVVFDDQMYDRVVTQAQLEQDFRQAIGELDV